MNDADGLCPNHRQNVERYGDPERIAKRPEHLAEHLCPIWDEIAPQVSLRIGFAGLEALCGQMYRLREAQKKITTEGLVVADARENPVPHPALKIEKEAQAEIRRWIKDYGVR